MPVLKFRLCIWNDLFYIFNYSLTFTIIWIYKWISLIYFITREQRYKNLGYINFRSDRKKYSNIFNLFSISYFLSHKTCRLINGSTYYYYSVLKMYNYNFHAVPFFFFFEHNVCYLCIKIIHNTCLESPCDILMN